MPLTIKGLAECAPAAQQGTGDAAMQLGEPRLSGQKRSSGEMDTGLVPMPVSGRSGIDPFGTCVPKTSCLCLPAKSKELLVLQRVLHRVLPGCQSSTSMPPAHSLASGLVLGVAPRMALYLAGSLGSSAATAACNLQNKAMPCHTVQPLKCSCHGTMKQSKLHAT